MTRWPSWTGARSSARGRSPSCWPARRSWCRSSAPTPTGPTPLLEATAIGADVQVEPDGLAITLPAGTDRDVIAEINRLLVEGGISVYRLQEIQASLESWFLQVTSRLGAPNDDGLRRRRTGTRSGHHRLGGHAGAITAARGSRPGA